MTLSTKILALSTLLLAACAEDGGSAGDDDPDADIVLLPDAGGEDPPPPPPTPPEPDCDQLDPYICLGSDQIGVCEDGSWVGYDCTQLCLDAGYDFATGCDTDPADGLNYCFCSTAAQCE